MAAYTAVVALLGLPVMSLLLLGRASPWKDEDLAFQLVPYFVLGAVVSTWMSAVFRSRGRSDTWRRCSPRVGGIARFAAGPHARVIAPV